MTRWKLSTLIAALCIGCVAPVPAQVPDPLDTLREQIRSLRTKKEFDRKELANLLATTPEGPYRCPTGELWPAFEEGAPHTAQTVQVLLDLYREHQDHWKRYHLLTALSRESLPSLRGFWLKLLSDPKLPTDYRAPAVSGLGRTGSDADVARLAQRLGTGSEWDGAILWVPHQRPQDAARSAVRARFRDRGAPGYIRAAALRALVRLGGAGVAGYLREAAGDESEALRMEAATLKEKR